jgi:HYR domain-containing protein
MLGRRTALAAVVAATIPFLVGATSSGRSAAGTLNLRATLATISPPGACPPEAPADADCHARTGRGPVRGLGSSSSSYTWFYGAASGCPPTQVKALATTGRIAVAGKGEIDFALAEGATCVDVEPVHNEPQDFTITGGTGEYQGASGSGTVERSLSGGYGVERWNGSLIVPGLVFDTTPPQITGAVSRTIRARAGAKRVRVTYKVRARDDVDGTVAAVCRPRSGAFFKIGRTVVRCTAKDTSANVRTARFVIRVRR